MPTGYTCYIEDGNITTAKDFIMLCTRAFGALISMRDEPLSTPIPQEIKADTQYADKMIQHYKNELAKYESLSPDEIHEMNRTEYENRETSRKKSLDKKLNIKKLYEQILSDVKAWIPPTDEHIKLKDFAIEQIEMCIPTERELSFYTRKETEMSDDEWIADKIELCRKNISYYEDYRKKEIEHAESCNNWLNAVRDSFYEG